MNELAEIQRSLGRIEGTSGAFKDEFERHVHHNDIIHAEHKLAHAELAAKVDALKRDKWRRDGRSGLIGSIGGFMAAMIASVVPKMISGGQ